MKKSNPFDEIIKILEDAVRNMQDEGTHGPIFIDVSIAPCRHTCPVPQEVIVRKNDTSVDILETEKNIHVLVGLPGMEKKDMALSCNGRVLEINAGNAENVETIELPARVIKKGMKATYQNGILEVILNKSRRGAVKRNEFY